MWNIYHFLLEISRAVQLSYYPPFTNKFLSARSSNVKADRLFALVKCHGKTSWINLALFFLISYFVHTFVRQV